MSATSVIGLQWGDEAKGKLVDILAPAHDIVVRYQGGANAGHTVVVGKEVYKLHHIPSGILHPGVMNVIAPGVVIEPNTMLLELEGLEARGLRPRENLLLSDRTHLVMPWHLVEDQILNAQVVHGENIGTTLRGIGPCYRDKVGRTFAVRVAEILSANVDERLQVILEAKRKLLHGLASEEQMSSLEWEPIASKVHRWAKELRPIACDTTTHLLDELDAGKRILLEGAQGALLDIDHGTFPFVTSSNSSGVGVSSGSGIPAKWVETVLGGGPFPTELTNEIGEKIRQIGREYGTTTGRPRRCGWFDAVAVRYTARLSGITSMALMMMDVLSHFDELSICIGYKLDGQLLHRFPSCADDLRRCEPVWETLPGWKTDITGIRDIEQLPGQAVQYLRRIEELIGIPIDIVSIGPDREQTILVGKQFREIL